MGSTAKLSKRTTVGAGEGWGMDFLLVFFPQDHHHHHHHQQPHTLLKRSNSSQILAKAQSTISVCALVILFTLLLFTLSTFEPNNASHHYRRHLSQSHSNLSKKTLISPALQRLGTLYSRGTKSMNDIVLCHVPESTTLTELKSFLRAFHMSGLLSKSDLLFIFPSITTPEFSDDVIREENRLFLKLIRRYKSELGNGSHVSDFPASFDVSQFVKSGKELNRGEPVWGRRIKSGGNSNYSDVGTELTRLSYGSVVGFGVGELDPENSLSGFLDHVPMSLRRWASYPMLLGRLRRNFKHVMLVDIKELVLLGDPLARVRNASPESVFLSTTKHNRKPTVNPAVIVGGARGVRRLSAAMLTEIVRTTTHKRKTPATESNLLSRLAANELVQKSIRVVVSTVSIPEASSLGGVGIASNKVVRRGNSNIDSELTKHICSFRIEASVYTECRKVQPF
ncbi:hypothetical protein L1987_22464 [Smallanthus sonchifolius]|uniref:Uncharacterized protein n=1 Tax=Smallanthus sonchifolius TaxID=185202 RepID=A0ACB9IFI9_9ASTR|nr:hypothetical protein L1987_22464 [Smallanthus sonchifolius]